ncbi:MAG: hypothetical protein IKH39_00520 [Candidatus Methanomethylophilaceae archaeon]|nr:hypothetical protein [Candidatus Methanomethylophilaceae archaeon]
MSMEPIREGVAPGIIATVRSVFVAVKDSFVIRKARGSFSAADAEPDV